MFDVKMYEERIKSLIQSIYNKRYEESVPLTVAYIYDALKPIPYKTAVKAHFKPITINQKWGDVWGSGWFKFSAKIPAHFAGKEVCALIDTDSEGCVFSDGAPWLGLTHHHNPDAWKWGFINKRLVPVSKKARAGEAINLLVETGANRLWGDENQNEYYLKTAELRVVNRAAWNLYHDVLMLENLQLNLPEQSVRRKRILFGLAKAAALWNDGLGTTDCQKICTALLMVPASASSLHAYAMGHAHLDLGWLWPIRETKRKGGRSFSTALRLAEEYKDAGYKFCATQPQLYKWMEELYPKLFRRLQKAVKSGTLECAGATWVEFDANVSGGEALVRQCLYGKDYFKRTMGVDVRNCLLPDSFGFNAQLPQILKKSGMDYFLSQKMCWNDTNKLPLHTFYWQALDGSQVLTHFLPADSYSSSNMPAELINAEKNYHQSEVSDVFMHLFGMGDGGGGPSRKHIELAMRQQNCDGVPRFTFDTIANLFERLAKIPQKQLPLWLGELYLEFHRGVYTTQALTKKLNRILEQELHNTEFLAAVSPATYPKKQLDTIWHCLMLHQFHDILPGSSIARVYREAESALGESLNDCRALGTTALKSIVPTSAAAKANFFAIVNTEPYTRTAVITLPHGSAALNAAGTPLETAILGKKLHVRVTVPSMGYTVVSLTKPSPQQKPAQSLIAQKNLLENSAIRVGFAPDGTIISLFDKINQRETIAGAANRLMLWQDPPNPYDAWDINKSYLDTPPQQAKLTNTTILYATPLKAAIEQRYTVSQSTIIQTISIEKDSPVITIASKVTWNEAHKMLRMRCVTPLRSQTATYEIQFGVVERSTTQNTSFDQAQFEVCAHSFADLSQPDYGFAILNDCKYGHRIFDGTLDLNLLRSPQYPDKTADIGTHEFTYALYPHAGTWQQAGVNREAHALNFPLIVQSLSKMPDIKELSFFNISGDTVKIETVKRAESGLGTIIRLYEICGTNSSVTLKTAKPYTVASETSMLEEIIKKLPGKGTSLKLSFTPFEIKTVLLR